jgi:hypothetical protein
VDHSVASRTIVLPDTSCDDGARSEIAKLRHELAVTRAQLGLPEQVPEPPRVRTYFDPNLPPMAAIAKSIYPDSFMAEDLPASATKRRPKNVNR